MWFRSSLCHCQCLSRQSIGQDTSVSNIYVLTADMSLCLFRVQSPTMMHWQRDLSARKATWVHPALVSRIGAYLCLLISEILEQIRSYRCRVSFGICSALCSCVFCHGIPPVECLVNHLPYSKAEFGSNAFLDVDSRKIECLGSLHWHIS